LIIVQQKKLIECGNAAFYHKNSLFRAVRFVKHFDPAIVPDSEILAEAWS